MLSARPESQTLNNVSQMEPEYHEYVHFSPSFLSLEMLSQTKITDVKHLDPRTFLISWLLALELELFLFLVPDFLVLTENLR